MAKQTKEEIEADLAYVTTILDAMNKAAKERRRVLHLKHEEPVYSDVEYSKNLLELRKGTLENKLRRIAIVGR